MDVDGKREMEKKRERLRERWREREGEPDGGSLEREVEGGERWREERDGDER